MRLFFDTIHVSAFFCDFSSLLLATGGFGEEETVAAAAAPAAAATTLALFLIEEETVLSFAIVDLPLPLEPFPLPFLFLFPFRPPLPQVPPLVNFLIPNFARCVANFVVFVLSIVVFGVNALVARGSMVTKVFDFNLPIGLFDLLLLLLVVVFCFCRRSGLLIWLMDVSGIDASEEADEGEEEDKEDEADEGGIMEFFPANTSFSHCSTSSGSSPHMTILPVLLLAVF